MAGEIERNSELREQLTTSLASGGERWGWLFMPPGEPGPSELRNSPPMDTRAPDYPARFAEWQRAIQEDEQRRSVQYLTAPVWWPFRGMREASIVNVYGGSGLGWRALLATLGLSLLGDGHHLTVADVTERGPTGPLVELAELCSFPSRLDEISATGSTFNVFQGLSNDQLISLLLSAVYEDGRDPGIAQDRAVLRRVAKALDPPVSLKRLQEALDCLLLESPSAELSETEFDRLATLFGRDLRDHGGVIERLARLESQLEEFAPFADLKAPNPDSTSNGEALHVIRVARDLELRDFDLAVDLVVQTLVRQIRLAGPATGDEILIFVGADRIRRRMIDSIASVAADNALRIVLLFEHLRDENMDALGAEDSRTVFMALKDHREASVAAEFIGKDFKFVMSNFTTSTGGSHGTSTQQTTGTEHGTNVSHGTGFGAQSSAGQSQSITESVGQGESVEANWSRSQALERVQEFVIQPEQFQHLAPTALVVWHDAMQQYAVLDCNPAIVTNEGVAP